MRIPTIYIVLLLIIYVPLEDTLLLVLHLPEPLYVAGRLVTEFFIFALLVHIFIQRAYSQRKLKWTQLEFPLLLFTVGACIAVSLNEASWIPAFVNMRALLRYVLLCFLLVQLDLNAEDVELLVKGIVLSAFLQVGFSLFQVAIPPADHTLRMWRSSVNVEIAGVTKTLATQKTGNATGTFDGAAAAGMFLCIAVVVQMIRFTLTPRFNLKWLLSVFLLLLGIFLTYKRSTLLLGLLAAGFIPLVFGNKTMRVRFIVGYMLVGFVVAPLYLLSPDPLTTFKQTAVEGLREEGITDISGYMSEILTSEYWATRFQASRGKVIFKVGEALVKDPQFFGYSPDVVTAKHRLIEKNPLLVWLLDYTPLEDVYWIAVWLYYGFWGILLWLFILFRIFLFGRSLAKRSTVQIDVLLGRAMQVIILLALFSAMTERTFEIRGFSFYLWLFAGLTISRLRVIRYTMISSWDKQKCALTT